MITVHRTRREHLKTAVHTTVTPKDTLPALPSDPATASLVHTLRNDRAAIEGQTGAHILIGGTTGSNIDVSSEPASALPIFLIVVVGLASILLTFAFSLGDRGPSAR